MAYGLSMVTCPMASLDLQRCCEAVRSPILATAWLLVIVPLGIVAYTENPTLFTTPDRRLSQNWVVGIKTYYNFTDCTWPS